MERRDEGRRFGEKKGAGQRNLMGQITGVVKKKWMDGGREGWEDKRKYKDGEHNGCKQKVKEEARERWREAWEERSVCVEEGRRKRGRRKGRKEGWSDGKRSD